MALHDGKFAAASFAAHKFHGPKGAGFLYLRAGVPIEAVQFGGAHENQRRPGTEDVAAIAGMAAAAEWSLHDWKAEQERQGKLRDRFWDLIKQSCPAATLNGDPTRRIANTLNVSFAGTESETILMALDLEGICASSGSACMVGSVVASHVLLAMGSPENLAASAVRFSLGHETTQNEIQSAGEIVARVIQRVGSARTNANAEVYATS
jgi:cysteine desulfurase